MCRLPWLYRRESLNNEHDGRTRVKRSAQVRWEKRVFAKVKRNRQVKSHGGGEWETEVRLWRRGKREEGRKGMREEKRHRPIVAILNTVSQLAKRRAVPAPKIRYGLNQVVHMHINWHSMRNQNGKVLD